MGDFNSCRLDSVLPSFKQYVDSHTRKEKVLDLGYGNISNAYTARMQPPLGSADHNIVFLLPQSRKLLKNQPSTASPSGQRTQLRNSRGHLHAQTGAFLMATWI